MLCNIEYPRVLGDNGPLVKKGSQTGMMGTAREQIRRDQVKNIVYSFLQVDGKVAYVAERVPESRKKEQLRKMEDWTSLEPE